jgi:Holliday junction DNA helicase RuvA
MFDFIEGTIAEISPTHAVINANGVGYMLHISLYTFEKMRGLKEAKLKAHLVVREDSHTLYGFADDAERQMFRHLIGVSGIGSATARMILSSLSEKELVQAIIQSNVALLKSIKGIGPKAAERMVLELRDKVGKGVMGGLIMPSGSNTAVQEALDALMALGFARSATEKVLMKVSNDSGPQATTEELIKNCLKLL